MLLNIKLDWVNEILISLITVQYVVDRYWQITIISNYILYVEYNKLDDMTILSLYCFTVSCDIDFMSRFMLPIYTKYIC